MNFKRPMCSVHKSCEVIWRDFFQVERFLSGVPVSRMPALGWAAARPSIKGHLGNTRKPVRDVGCHQVLSSS